MNYTALPNRSWRLDIICRDLYRLTIGMISDG